MTTWDGAILSASKKFGFLVSRASEVVTRLSVNGPAETSLSGPQLISFLPSAVIVAWAVLASSALPVSAVWMVSQMSLGTWVDQMCAGSTYIVITLENQVLSGFAEFWSNSTVLSSITLTSTVPPAVPGMAAKAEPPSA